MADPLDRILCMLETPPSNIEKYCAEYGNIKLLRSYNKIHYGLVKYAVKGEQLVILKFLLTQKSRSYNAEIDGAILNACRYNKIIILNFIKYTVHSGCIVGHSNLNGWATHIHTYMDGQCINYTLENDSLDCFIWVRENIHDGLRPEDIYVNDSVTILKYICADTPALYSTVSCISKGIQYSSMKCLQTIYSIAPIEITPRHIRNAINKRDVALIRWLSSITDISDYASNIALEGIQKLWDILTDEQLSGCLERMINLQQAPYIQYCIQKKLMSEKLFKLCFHYTNDVRKWNLLSIFELYVEYNVVGMETLTYIRNIAESTGQKVMWKRIDNYAKKMIK